MAASEDHSKLLYWIMSGLLALAMAAGGFYLKELHSRVEQYNQRESSRYETLNSTNSQRGERMATFEVKLATIEPRLTTLEGKFSQIEPRMPLVDNRISRLESQLERIDSKLDQLLRMRTNR